MKMYSCDCMNRDMSLVPRTMTMLLALVFSVLFPVILLSQVTT